MTPRPLDGARPTGLPGPLLEAIAAVRPSAAIAADADPADWRRTGGIRAGLALPGASGKDPLAEIRSTGRGSLQLFDPSGPRLELPWRDDADPIDAAPLFAAALAEIEALVRAGTPVPDGLRDWMAVAVAIDRDAAPDGGWTGLDRPEIVEMATPWSPTRVETMKRTPSFVPPGGNHRALPADAGARMDAACPMVCAPHVVVRDDGAWRIVVMPISDWCAPDTAEPIMTGGDPVALLRAFAAVRAAGGIA